MPAQEGFEKGEHIPYRLAEEGECDAHGLPKSYMHFCVMADLGGMRWPGMLAMVNPLIQAVAAHARWSGEGERLLNKYWYRGNTGQGWTIDFNSPVPKNFWTSSLSPGKLPPISLRFLELTPL